MNLSVVQQQRSLLRKRILLPDFKFKVEFSDQTVSEGVKITFDSKENILVKPDTEATTDNLKIDLFGQGKKSRNFLRKYS